MAGRGFEFVRGALHWPRLGLWFDAHEAVGPRETALVSHAHSDHCAAHARAAATPATLRLMRARTAGKRVEVPLEFHRRTGLEDLLGRPAGPGGAVTLLPAGHILGSAMPFLEYEDTSLLYTGDFKLRPGLSAERCEPCRADILVMETTFGLPTYTFPPTEAVVEGILRFCREAIGNGETPVLLGYSLGKAQEVHAALAASGLEVALSPAVAKLTPVYETLGVRLPPWTAWTAGPAPDKVLLAPPGAGVAALRRELGPCRVAALTGWAMDPGCRFQHRADAAFPLSDHADFGDLVLLVHQVAPRKVYTLHGFAAEFAAHLRGIGVEAEPLGAGRQLELPLRAPSRRIRPSEALSASNHAHPTPEPTTVRGEFLGGAS